jgi:arylsulfatase A-like enzyme
MPWVMHGVGVAQGQRVGGVASQVDVMPTLLGLAGLEAPTLTGQDWTPQARGAMAATTRDVAFVDTWFQQANRFAGYSVERSCHYDGRGAEDLPAQGRRLPQTTCYDQILDPYQMEPLGHEDESLLGRMHEWRAERLSEYEAFEHKEDVQVDVDLMEQLSALGYVDEGEI